MPFSTFVYEAAKQERLAGHGSDFPKIPFSSYVQKAANQGSLAKGSPIDEIPPPPSQSPCQTQHQQTWHQSQIQHQFRSHSFQQQHPSPCQQHLRSHILHPHPRGHHSALQSRLHQNGGQKKTEQRHEEHPVPHQSEPQREDQFEIDPEPDMADPSLHEAQPRSAEECGRLMMLRNLPCKLKKQDVHAVLQDLGFQNKYTAIRLVMRGTANLGYAFVEFVSNEDAFEFSKSIHDFRFEGTMSQKRLWVCPASPSKRLWVCGTSPSQRKEGCARRRPKAAVPEKDPIVAEPAAEGQEKDASEAKQDLTVITNHISDRAEPIVDSAERIERGKRFGGCWSWMRSFKVRHGK